MVTYLITILLTNKIEITEVGEYYFVLNIFTVLPVILSLGIPTWIVREVGLIDDELGAYQLYRIGCISILVILAFLFLVLIALNLVLDSQMTFEYSFKWIHFFVIILGTFTMLNIEFLRAVNVIRSSEFGRNLIRPIVFVLLLLVSFLLSGNTDVIRLLCVSMIIQGLHSFYLIWKWKGKKIAKRKWEIDFKQALRPISSGIPYLIVFLVSFFSDKVSIIFLSIFSNFEEQALFTIPLRLVMLTTFSTYAVIITRSTSVSEMYNNGDILTLNRILHRDINRSVVIGLLIIIPMLCIPDVLLGFFGEEYTSASEVLRILSFAYFFNLISGVAPMYLSMTGKLRALNSILVVTAILHLTMLYFWVPTMGAMGAAYGTLCSMFFSCLCGLGTVWYYDGILLIPGGEKRYVSRKSFEF